MLPVTRAQDQERKLIDRILRPDTQLQNDAQNKKFVADRRPINKQAAVGTFYAQKKTNSKEFAGGRNFSSWEFNARSFSGRKQQANSSSRNQIMNSHTRYATRATMNLRAAHDANRIGASSAFAEQRPFLDKGKSQNALSQQNRALTIEEVRELLNKNK